MCVCVIPDDSAVKGQPAKAGDPGLTPGLGDPPGGGNGNSLQHSCLGNPMDRGAWRATAHGVAKNQIRLSDSTTAAEPILTCMCV